MPHYTLTLSGAAQSLLAAATAEAPTTQAGATANIPLRALILQPDGGNGAPIYLGSDNTVTTTSYGVRLELGAAGVPPAALNLGPYAGSGPLKLSDFWVIGTAAQKLHLLAIPF